MHKHNAFTLFEMLVVIAVIALLALVLLPVMGTVRAKSESTACASNLRSIGQGILLYANENSGELPAGASVDRFTNWYHLLEPYVGQVVTDPESEERLDWQQCPSKQFESEERRHVGYGWNYLNFGYLATTPAHGWRVRVNEVEEPSNTIIVGDSPDLEVVEGKPYMNIYIYNESNPEFLSRRHSGGGNYLMVDGSVRFYEAEELLRALPEIYQVKKNG